MNASRSRSMVRKYEPWSRRVWVWKPELHQQKMMTRVACHKTERMLDKDSLNPNNKQRNIIEEPRPETEPSKSWDDDDFDLSFDDLEINETHNRNMQQVMPAHKYLPRNDGEDAESWLSHRDGSELAERLPCMQQKKTDHFLTRQFESLNTPASRKKSRCSICTRPLAEDTTGRFCKHCVKKN